MDVQGSLVMEGVELGGRRSKIHREKMTALAMPRVIVRKDK